MQIPVVDRRVFEELFRVRRRRAADLVQRFGGYRSGNTSLVDRQKLIEQLRQLESDPDVICEMERKRRIAVELEEVQLQSRAARIVIGHTPTAWARREWAMPASVSVSGGALTVEFSDPEDLLRQLYHLSEAAAADFERFYETIAGGAKGAFPEKPEEHAPVPLIR